MLFRSTSFVLDTILNATNILLDQLDEQTVYYCYLRPVCGTDAYGPYYDQEISFKTLCPVKSLPYLETFSGMQLDGLTPNCWERYRGNINTVKSTGEFTETSSSWIPRISENPVDSHMVVYVYGANIMEWLVSPDIILPAAASLSFDLRLTEPNSDNAPDVFIPRNDEDRKSVV